MGENDGVKKLKPIHYTIAGATSGALTRIISQPLDVLKIHFQIRSAKITQSDCNSLMSTIRHIFQNEGIHAFWKGHVPAQALSITFGSLMFTSYEVFHSLKYFSNKSISYPAAYDFVCGGFAGMLATSACQPFDVIRTRLVAQDASKAKRKLFHSVAILFKESGPRGFFKGLSPTLIAIFPYNGISFALYGSLKRAWLHFSPNNKETQFSRLCCGGLSGLGSKLMLLPFDTVKKHLQVQGLNEYTNEYKGMFNCFKTLMQKNGIVVLYSGAYPAVLKSMVVVAASFSSYELICDLLCCIDP